MREYMSIAVRSVMHFITYRYCCKGQPCIYSLETLGECQEWLETGHPVYFVILCQDLYDKWYKLSPTHYLYA